MPRYIDLNSQADLELLAGEQGCVRIINFASSVGHLQKAGSPRFRMVTNTGVGGVFQPGSLMLQRGWPNSPRVDTSFWPMDKTPDLVKALGRQHYGAMEQHLWKALAEGPTDQQGQEPPIDGEVPNLPQTDEQWMVLGQQLGIDRLGVSPEAWKEGCLHEWGEHGETVDGDYLTIAKITRDHLKENPNYYQMLAQLEMDAQQMQQANQAEPVMETEDERDMEGQANAY